MSARIYKDLIAIPPGATLEDEMNCAGVTEEELAEKLQMSPLKVRSLINGDLRLDHSIAKKLEEVLGVPASLWINLEKNFRKKLEEIWAAKQLSKIDK